MSERFFNKGSYQLRLDDIRPKEAKPAKRIHLNCSMALSEDDLEFAPSRIRRIWEIVANPKLDTFRIPMSSQLKGIDIEIFAIEPTKNTPLVVCLSGCILRDIHLDREKVDTEWEVRLNFSVGITWDSAVWKWGEKYVFMECFAKFSQSQAELFDDNPADAAIATPEAQRLRGAEVDDLAKDLGTNAAEVTETPAVDPLQTDLKPRRGKRTAPLAFKASKGDSRPHA